MSEKLPERADMRQLRIQAKELLRTLPEGAKLAEAQLQIARQYGFDSWPKLVAEIEIPALLGKFKYAVYSGDADGLEKLLKGSPNLRKHVNDPIFDFDGQAIVQAARQPHSRKLLPILVRYGADPNIRTKWWAGGFSALDGADAEAAEILVQLGAKFDVWSAAKQGRTDDLAELLDRSPESVNAPGGDGQRPLHVAKDAATASLLIERGADLEVRDIDHEGTPIQYQVNNLDVVRVLLKAGAKPDIFTAVVLDDVDLLRQVLKDDPRASEARTGRGDFTTKSSNGGHISIYVLGPDKTPLQLAAERGSRKVLDELLKSATPPQRLVAAAWAEDEALVQEIVKAHPSIASEMGSDARAITDAAQAGKAETVRLLLEAGLDPSAPGMDSGSALHLACWFGWIEVVRLLVDRVPLDLIDAPHGSPPLGWACHGAQWCRNSKGDYVAVVEELIAHGADLKAPGNKNSTPMLDMAGEREDIKAVLKSHGA